MVNVGVNIYHSYKDHLLKIMNKKFDKKTKVNNIVLMEN